MWRDKKPDLMIFITGTVILGSLLFIPELPDSVIYANTLRSSLHALKGRSDPSDLTQDIVGFRALVRQQTPYPVIGVAVQELGIMWNVEHSSTHPPTAFLFVAPIAFLSWELAAMLWAWAMLGLLCLTFRLYGLSWLAAWGWTCIALLWPPILASLGQFTIIWLFGWTMGFTCARQRVWASGLGIGVASLTKLVPILMVIVFILGRRWRVLGGVLLVWSIAIVILMFLSPQALFQFVESARLNSMAMILRDDNASLMAVGYRSWGWLGAGCGLAFLGLVVWANKNHLFDPGDRFPSWELWMVMSYVIVNLLPVFWLYSFTPLLIVIISLVTRRKIFAVFIGGTCLAVPFFVPPWGPVAVFPFVFINLLLGIGLIANALPFRVFSAQSLKDLFGGGASDIPLWNLRDIEYVPIARWLDQNARADDSVMAADPPAFYNASQRRSIVIPTDSVDAIFLAAQKYGARYLVLQFDHPTPLNDLYHEQATIPGLVRVADFRDGNGRPVMLFEVAR